MPNINANNSLFDQINALDTLLYNEVCRLPIISKCLEIKWKIDSKAHDFVSNFYYERKKKDLPFFFFPIDLAIRGTSGGLISYVTVLRVFKTVQLFCSITGLAKLFNLSERLVFWSAQQITPVIQPLTDPLSQTLQSTAKTTYGMFSFFVKDLSTLGRGVVVLASPVTYVVYSTALGLDYMFNSIEDVFINTARALSLISTPVLRYSNYTKPYSIVPELEVVGEATRLFLEAERAAKLAKEAASSLTKIVQSFCPIGSGPVNNATITLGQCPNLFQPVSNGLETAKNLLPPISTLNIFKFCPTETLDLADKCIPGVPFRKPFVETIKKVVPITVERAQMKITEIASTTIPENTTLNLSSYLPMFGMIVATAAVGYGLFKLYQHYQQTTTVTNPEIVEESVSIDGIEPLTYANEILSGNRFIVTRYICSSAVFAYATVYSTVRATIHLALTLLLLPSIVFQNGRALIRQNFCQTLLHLSAAITAATGTIFPYAGNALYQAQMRSYYPALQTLSA